MTAKRRYVYNLFSASELKSKADIPEQDNITIVDDTVDYIACINVSKYFICDFFSLDRDTGLIDLCRYAGVNRWAAFCPVERGFSGTGWTRDLVNNVPTLCRQLDFAGYNHDALTPGWQTGGQAIAEAEVWVNLGSKGTVECRICIGEVNWNDINAGWVIAVIFNASDVPIGWSKVDINTVANNFTIYPETVDPIALDHLDYYGRFVICDDAEIAQLEDVESAILCRVPNTNTFEVNFKVKAASAIYYDATGTGQPPSPWVNNNGVLGINWNTGVVTIGYDLEATQSWTNVRFQATLYNWLDEVIGQADIFDDVYNALDSVYGSAYVGMTNIPLFGYTVKVEIFYTI